MQDNTQPPPLFDRALLRRRRLRAIDQGADGVLLRLVIDELQDRLEINTSRFPLALALGDPSPALGEAIAATGKVDAVISGDLCHIPPRHGPAACLELDEEALPFTPASFDLIVSALSLQWANDLPGVLARHRQALKPGGLFLGAMTGGRTLIELRTALQAAEQAVEGGVSPRVAPVADLRQMGDLLARAGFTSPVADLDSRILRYDGALDLMRDLRRFGAANVLNRRRRQPLRAETLAYAAEYYAEHFSDPDGRVRASFDFIYLSGWRGASD